MARNKAKPQDDIRVLELRGHVGQRHPQWGPTGRPILIGDQCTHVDLGICNVTALQRNKATIKARRTELTHDVHVQELRRDVDVLDRLYRAERITG